MLIHPALPRTQIKFSKNVGQAFAAQVPHHRHPELDSGPSPDAGAAGSQIKFGMTTGAWPQPPVSPLSVKFRVNTGRGPEIIKRRGLRLWVPAFAGKETMMLKAFSRPSSGLAPGRRAGTGRSRLGLVTRTHRADPGSPAASGKGDCSEGPSRLASGSHLRMRVTSSSNVPHPEEAGGRLEGRTPSHLPPLGRSRKKAALEGARPIKSITENASSILRRRRRLLLRGHGRRRLWLPDHDRPTRSPPSGRCRRGGSRP